MTERGEPATDAGQPMTERRPATEAGRFWNDDTHGIFLDAILAIEAQATDARVAALVEALGPAARARHASGYTNSPHVYRDPEVPMDGANSYKHHAFESCPAEDCATVRALLSDLPVATAERPLDVERLARALRPVTRELSRPDHAWRLKTARAIAAEYARLSEADR